MQVQTDDEPKKKLRLAEDRAGGLTDFLRRIEPYIMKQLAHNLRSRAFDGIITVNTISFNGLIL